MAPMPITDAMFLLAERREHPMHVGGLQLFTAPEGAGRNFVNDLYSSVLESDDEIHPLFRRRAHRPLTSLGQWSWTHDEEIDLEHHVRHSALPKPARIRELLALCSRLHGSLLDRNRPLWEGHLIEGLQGRQFALYTKIHHAMTDGVSALRMLQDALSTDPGAELPPLWAMPVRHRGATSVTNVVPTASGVAKGAFGAVTNLAGSTRAIVTTLQEILREQTSGLASHAPKTMFNVGISGARRFAAQSWPIDKVKAIGKATGGTLNDVVLAMCSGALRAYLEEQGALPDAPLVAMVPVSMRTSEEARAAGNAVGLILCDLATDEKDALERLDRVMASTNSAKERMKTLGPTPAMVLAALSVMPRAAAGGLLGDSNPFRPPFNIVISNVPGPREPLYWNGARLDGLYPLSIPMDGQALNITITSYVDKLEFGLTGCRQRVPHLQRLLGHLDESLSALAEGAGV